MYLSMYPSIYLPIYLSIMNASVGLRREGLRASSVEEWRGRIEFEERHCLQLHICIYIYLYIYINCPQLQCSWGATLMTVWRKPMECRFLQKNPIVSGFFAERVLQWWKCDDQTERVGVSSRARTTIKCVQSNCHAVWSCLDFLKACSHEQLLMAIQAMVGMCEGHNCVKFHQLESIRQIRWELSHEGCLLHDYSFACITDLHAEQCSDAQKDSKE